MPLWAFACLGILWLTAAPAAAQAGPSGEPLAVLWVDAQGRWDPLQQGEVALNGAVGDYHLMLKSSSVHRLSWEQRAALLREPERLLASSKAPKIFAYSRLLLMEPHQEGRVAATYWDLQKQQQVPMVADPDQSTESAREQLFRLASDPLGPYAVPVVANLQSQLYHLAGARHLPPEAPVKALISNYEAENQGFRRCEICFEEVRRPSMDDFERQLGEAVGQQVQAQFRLSQNSKLLERVERVGQRLVKGNRLGHDYRFVVLDSDRINAFAVPTGPLYITTGLLGVVESDDELATIMGHELAHAELHHGLRQYEQSQQLSWLGLLATIATGSRWVYSATQMFGTVLSRGYSRDFELEADRQGLWYAYGAGFRADHFKLTLQKFLELETRRGGGGFSWLRTHPGSEQRLQEVNEILGRLEPLGLLVEEIEPEDPGLAAYLKRRASQFLESPGEVLSFYSAYRSLTLEGKP